ncbi:hypothetical protein HALLA_15055 [Halostagnicola larsenii XH-48]|uniref:Uncharacterized protein n=1 Tax=Halostagnicola larsenii XH-48 TaxID=797299 RepID=W0JQQ5_9EURY|nr:hypothetical protein HALLA_15055 [Halostagnicola larsenii XH-48]
MRRNPERVESTASRLIELVVRTGSDSRSKLL